MDDRLGVGDAVVATELVQHDLAGPPEMFARSELPLLGAVELATDAALTAAAIEASNDFHHRAFDVLVFVSDLADLGIGLLLEHLGQVATGDEFIDGGLKDLVRRRAAALCVDMEGAAVAEVCFELGGTPLAVIRAISDLASGTASVHFLNSSIGSPRTTPSKSCAACLRSVWCYMKRDADASER